MKYLHQKQIRCGDLTLSNFIVEIKGLKMIQLFCDEQIDAGTALFFELDAILSHSII